MNCPACKTVNLVMSERQGIEIDYCPQCRGVWLDRGELDKIIERSANVSPAHPVEATPSPPYSGQPPHSHYDPRRESHQHGHYDKRKRKGFLSEIFDFD